MGMTTVNCSVKDASDNTATCSFTINVSNVAFNVTDPLACTGPGNVVTGTFNVTNSGVAPVGVAATVTLPPGDLLALPGTCTANAGTCSVVNPATVAFTATLAPGQTATVSYDAQVGDLVVGGTQLCSNFSVSFGGGPALTVQACVTVNCPAIGPGLIPLAASPPSDQKAGSVLVYNVYTSSASLPNLQNTQINMTNVHRSLPAFVHMFFVDGTTCSIADSFMCLTQNQTVSFLASDLDPGTTGYLLVVAVDQGGCPTSFNYLIGDEYVKFASGTRSESGCGSDLCIGRRSAVLRRELADSGACVQQHKL